MYDINPKLGANTLLQGDVIRAFPFFKITSNAVIGENTTFTEAQLRAEPAQTNIIILTQTCDISRRSHILIAPVYSIEQEIEAGRFTEGQADGIRDRSNGYWFFLSEKEGYITDSFIDLLTIHYVPKELIGIMLRNRIISLNDHGIHMLCWTLTKYLSRPITDVEIKVKKANS